MKTKKHIILITGFLVVAFAVSIRLFIFDFRTTGSVHISLKVQGMIPNGSYTGSRIQISDGVYVKITGVTPSLAHDNALEKYTINAVVYCDHLTKFSFKSNSWESVYLGSSSDIEHVLRDHFGITPQQAISISGNKNLMP